MSDERDGAESVDDRSGPGVHGAGGTADGTEIDVFLADDFTVLSTSNDD